MVRYSTNLLLLPISLLCLIGQSLAGPLAEDSTCFAQYWDLRGTGNRTAARKLLHDAKDGGLGCTKPLANFLLAWSARQDGDPAGVLLSLDQGIPADLEDYAEWLRAEALTDAKQGALARTHWARLGEDTTSIFEAEALSELALGLRNQPQPDDLLHLVDRHARSGAPLPDRQKLAQLAAAGLTAAGRYEDAVDRLWQAYSLAPTSGEAEQIQDLLSGYKKKYGHAPRAQTRAEIETELQTLEASGNFAAGLDRVGKLASSSGANPNDEILDYYRGRFQSGLGRHRDAVVTLQGYLRRFAQGDYQFKARLYLGRSAYLSDQDGIAIPELETASQAQADPRTAGEAFNLLGLLNLDRGRPADAVKAFRECATLRKGTPEEADCLWRLGRALWEANQMPEAAAIFQRLSELNEASDYASAGRYWSNRAAAKAGQSADAQAREDDLLARFPYSYYAVLSSAQSNRVAREQRPLIPPSLDDLLSYGPHSRKFAMLTAMRLSDLALREWPLARRELPGVDGFLWWKAQHYLWQGNRSAAWIVILSDLGTYLRSDGPRPADFISTAYPLRFETEIRSRCAKYGLDPSFVFGLICQESHYNPGAVSPVGAIGLMQLMPPTARLEARKLRLRTSPSRLYDPAHNLDLGISHLAGLFEQFQGDTILVLCAYNAGESRAQAWRDKYGMRERDVFIERIPFRETRLFVKRNIEHRAAYRRLYPDSVRPDE